MRISVFGLGYVGCVSAACFASEKHKVIGVDVREGKVKAINEGQSPIIEPKLSEIIQKSVSLGNLKATNNAAEAIINSDISFICVGTPSKDNGDVDLNFVEKVCKEIGEVMREKADYHLIVLRSTVLPGTVEEIIIPLLEESSGKKVGEEFGISMNPEFLREGTAIEDFYQPPYTIIGEYDGKSGEFLERFWKKLPIVAPIYRVKLKIAEMLKYTSNVFHGLKIVFANEVGRICKTLDIDSREVMNLFCEDKQLNISSCYFKPGFSFGGSCLPKDIRALTYLSKVKDIKIPAIEKILNSNELHLKELVQMILKTRKRKVGILGISFKAGTDDLRESPAVSLAESLIGKGMKVRIYDKNINLQRLIGANKEYIETKLPHIARLLCSSLGEVIKDSEVVVISNKNEGFVKAIKNQCSGKIVIDLVGIPFDLQETKCKYYGICW